MDKSTLATYEFVPVNAEAGSDQFFVVQDDGTYLINRQVQYVTEAQDVKTVLDGVQSCTVYDVSEQPFYVDVDNSSELMSVSDQFILPETSNNLYANSYLLQTGPSSDQVEQDITEAQFKPNPNLSIDLGDIKPANNCMEITLSDEQYQKLEQKGWLLLEVNDKIFVLDTLGGLQDITSNNKLIQKLRNEAQADINTQSVKVENSLSPMEIDHAKMTPQPNAMEFVTADTNPQNNGNIGHLAMAANDLKNVAHDPSFVNEESVKVIKNYGMDTNETPSSLPQSTDPFKDVNVFLVKSENGDTKDKGIIRIKTKLALKDIPDRIVLGKTPEGKTLVARVRKPESAREEIVTEPIPAESIQDQNIINNLADTSDTSFDAELQFPDLIKQAIQCTEHQISPKELQMLDMIIGQLTEAEPPMEPSIKVDDYLFITKIVKKEDSKGNVTFKSKPTIWTGCVQTVNNQRKFANLPTVLQTLLFSEENSMVSSTVVHIQILDEIRQGTNIIKTSVTVNKKQLTPGRPKRMDTVYACSSCAAIFESEADLKKHHEDCLKTMDTNDLMTMDSLKLIRCVTSGKSKLYECLQCNIKFNRLSHCRNHMNIHYNLKNKQPNIEDKTNTKTSSEVYKCNMCPSVYLHASTLSKHIVSSHLTKAV